MQRLLGLVSDPGLLAPPVHALRLALAPGGLAPHILNLPEWRAHLLDRLRHQLALTADPAAASLLAELSALPAPSAEPHGADLGGIAIPLRLATPAGVLSLIGTVTVFGTPTDVTLSELALETFFPADGATMALLRAAA